MGNQNNGLIDAIPEPSAILERMADLMREQDLLRAVLKVAERKQKLIQQPLQQGASHDE